MASQATPHLFTLGTGTTLYDHIWHRILQEVQHELVLVTCFWASSESLTTTRSLLIQLSELALQRSTRIRVRICFSSLSLFQKLFHTRSEDGHIYDPHCYVRRLGLPPPKKLSGVELQVKSIFIIPFSVMHPKYIIIDRRLALLPSCNVSWESWFEGCLEFRGGAVEDLFKHWQSFLGRGDFALPTMLTETRTEGYASEEVTHAPSHEHVAGNSKLLRCLELSNTPVSSYILPSIYHINPRFRLFPFQAHPPAPKTALNQHTLDLIDNAKCSIFVTTPNITSPPFLHAILSAVSRGVDVTIITNDKFMTIEQVLTAGTTTPRCVAWLAQQYTSITVSATNKRANSADFDVERTGALLRPGKLDIQYYVARKGEEGLPVKLHLKLMVVDDERILLGSGNMDRASWYTSQELGVALESSEVSIAVRDAELGQLSGNTRTAYRSDE